MPYTKDFHFSPLGQRGGLSTYPVAGVVDGAILGLTDSSVNPDGIDDTDATDMSLTVSAGTVRFDGYPVKFTTKTVTLPAGVDLTTDAADGLSFKIYMSPKRRVPIVTSLPSASGYAEGDFIAKALLRDGGAYDEYYVVEQIYVKDTTVWREIEPFNGNDYPRAYGWNNMPYNDIDTTDVVFSLQPEIPVFLDSKLPPHTARPLAMFRQTASIYLGEVSFTHPVATTIAAITETMPEYHLLPI